ncbi:MAG TPA: EAL domain-containing protein [Limnobacter sp.]|nr:EAL domain-containing protein [Limnobacter sp.]
MDTRHGVVALSMMLLVVFLAASFFSLSTPPESSNSAVTVQFSSRVSDGEEGSLFDLIEALKASNASPILRTQLNEQPFWVYANLQHRNLADEGFLSFRSRHWVESGCWRQASSGALEALVLHTDHGRRLMVDMRDFADTTSVLCNFRFVGPATLQIDLQSRESYESRNLILERRQAYLEGVLYLMIGLVAVASLMTGNLLFLCYGFWLFASLRVVAMQEGWDHFLLGFQLSAEALVHARMIALAMYYTATVLIVTQLFENIRRPAWRGVLRGLQASCFLLFVLALFSPYKNFLELFWPMSLLAIGVVAWVVVQHFLEKKDLIAVYYMAAMGCMLMGAAAEVLAAWFDITTIHQYFNSASTTVLSSMMTAVALAEFLRKAQLQKLAAADQIRQAHERLESVFNIAPSAMFTSSQAGALLQFNHEFEQRFLDSQGLPMFDFLSIQALQRSHALLSQEHAVSREEIPVVLGEGQTRWYELVLTRDGAELVGMVSDFTQRKDRELALQYQATHDELTGALNRRGLQDHIHRQLSRKSFQFALFCLDVRQFGKVISAHGLSVADGLLKSLHVALFRSLSRFGEVARLHVDHFVVVVNPHQLLEAELAFDEFLTKVQSDALQVANRSVQVELLACRVYLGGVDNVLDVMDTLEVSMRETKVKTKGHATGRPVVFEVQDTRRLLEQSRIVRRLGDHQLPTGLTLVWQPILPLSQYGGPLYAEALLRIRGADGELKSAGSLIDACVTGGHTAFLDNWVLSQSLEFLARHADKLRHLNALSINVSPGSLNNDSFLQDTLALIRLYGPQASKLCLEITEVGSVINLQAVQRFIEQARLMGVRIALDDFGAGYSNFRYAIDLRVDVIKIDGSIIRGLCQNTESHAVTIAITSLAHDLGCKCVAEWVEDLHTLREIKELGIDYAQGYVVSPAIDPSRFFNARSAIELMDDSQRAEKVQGIAELVVGVE